MTEEEYRFVKCIPPDREYYVLEFWQADKQLAEANVESGQLVLQIYPKPGGGWWEIPAVELEGFLQRARELKLPNEE